MKIVEHVSLLHAGASSGYMPRSSIAGFLVIQLCCIFEANLCKKSVDVSLGPCRIWINCSILFPLSSTMSQVFKVAM